MTITIEKLKESFDKMHFVLINHEVVNRDAYHKKTGEGVRVLFKVRYITQRHRGYYRYVLDDQRRIEVDEFEEEYEFINE